MDIGKTIDPAELQRLLCDWRGVETPCERCAGAGVRTYASTATWRGGIGGQAVTNAVCDRCWGSGDEHRHWVDLRALERRLNGSP